MSGSCWESLPEVWEAIPEVCEWSRHPTGCPGVVESPSQMSGSGREALPDVRDWLKGYPECPGVVRRPPRMSGSGRRPSQLSGSGQ